MPIDDDLSMSLPQPPPPPRPARREAAIEAALRRFDGAGEDAPAAADSPRVVPPPWWTRLSQPQFGVAVSAAIVAVIGVPAALIAIRDRSPAPVQEAVAPPATPSAQFAPCTPPDCAPAGNASSDVPRTTVSISPVAEEPPNAPPSSAAPARKQNERIAPADELAKEEAPPPLQYAPAGPPPPPPPPAPQAAPAVAESGDIITTGTRIRQPSLEQGARKATRGAETAIADAAGDPSYATFVTRLQAAIRANDRAAVLKLVGYPLRVNSSGRSRSYPNARSVERDFDRIFTPRVRQSILAQRPDQLFTRDQGAMIGDGEVWFDHSCLNSGCTALGPVRITAVNP